MSVKQTSQGVEKCDVILNRGQIWSLSMDYIECLVKFHEKIKDYRTYLNKVVIAENSETVNEHSVLVAPIGNDRVHLNEIRVSIDQIIPPVLNSGNKISHSEMWILPDELFTINPNYLDKYFGSICSSLETQLYQASYFKVKLR